MVPLPFGSGQGSRDSLLLDSHSQRIFRMRKGVLTSARLVNDRLIAEGGGFRWVSVMVTLTYRDSDAWAPDHISEFIGRFQKYARRKNHGVALPYVWVLELQKRGAVHYHVMLWMPKSWFLPNVDKRGWWTHGSSRVERAKSAVAYLAKYASKGESSGSDVPKGARIHGIGGLLKREARIVAWWKLPKALRRGEEGSEVWRRAPGGGWVCREGESAGEFVPPLWGLAAVASVAEQLHDGRIQRIGSGRVLLVERGSVVQPSPAERVAERESLEAVFRERVFEDSRDVLAASVNFRSSEPFLWINSVEAGQWDFRARGAVVVLPADHGAAPSPGSACSCGSCQLAKRRRFAAGFGVVIG